MKRILSILALGCGAFVVFVLAVNIIFYVWTKPYIYRSVSGSPDAQVVIIPGAAVHVSGALSPIFKDRADMAIELYREKKVSKILVSGDNSTVSHNEVNPVREYLLKNNIPDQDIFLDHAGFDTYSTMYRARDIFRVSSILISTQSFHLPRAVFIARSLGITAYGVNASSEHTIFQNYFREVFANEKAVFDLITMRKPKYLGNQIPITGDGGDNL